MISLCVTDCWNTIPGEWSPSVSPTAEIPFRVNDLPSVSPTVEIPSRVNDLPLCQPTVEIPSRVNDLPLYHRLLKYHPGWMISFCVTDSWHTISCEWYHSVAPSPFEMPSDVNYLLLCHRLSLKYHPVWLISLYVTDSWNTIWCEWSRSVSLTVEIPLCVNNLALCQPSLEIPPRVNNLALCHRLLKYYSVWMIPTL